MRRRQEEGNLESFGVNVEALASKNLRVAVE